MHPGSIHNPNTACGRVYRYLRDRAGTWVDAGELGRACDTTALSTQISGIRAQTNYNPNNATGYVVESDQRGRKWYYRIVPVQGQMELEQWKEAV